MTLLQSDPSSDLLFRAALTYVRRGWPVLPLHNLDRRGICTCGARETCQTPGKHPRIRDWPNEATTDLATIRRWWHDRPRANVGSRLGGGRAVLDIDPRAGGDEVLVDLEREHGTLPLTPTVLTGGGGAHYHFRTAGDLPSVTIAPGVELKASGAQVVMPPSYAHVGGRRYQWDAGAHPADIPLAPLPDWVRRLALEKVNEGKNPPGWAAEWLRTPIAAGGRRGPDGVPKLVGYLRSHGIDCETSIAILELWDRANAEPLGSDEIRKHVEGMYRRYGVTGLRVEVGQPNGTAPFEYRGGQVMTR